MPLQLRGNDDQRAGGVIIVDSPLQARQLLAAIAKSDGPAGLDCETAGVDPTKESPVYRGRIVCWSLAYFDRSLPAHSTRGIQLARRAFIPNWGPYEKLLPLFRDFLSRYPVLGHNLYTFDSHMFANEGVPLGNIVGDTLRMSKLWNPSKLVKHGLKPLAKGCLGYDMLDFDDLRSRPKHACSHFQERETVKGEKYDVAWRHTHRKVGDQKRVPTVVASGERCTFHKTTEVFELDELVRDYPQRIPALIDYASLDAKADLELYTLICAKMRSRRIA